jgi:glycosyltransferase involved in cell wall biosynthesis
LKNSEIFVHVINSLGFGGAERMLQKLLSTNRFKNQKVFNLLELGPIGDQLLLSGASVSPLNLRRSPLSILKLFNEKPHVITGWLYHSCLVVTFYKILRPKTKIIWNIRHSLHDVSKEKWSIRMILKVLKTLNFLPDGIIFNSELAREQHSFLLHSNARTLVIPNGFEVQRFTSSSIECSPKIIGLFARYHPMKGHKLMLEAFAEITDMDNDWKLCFVGTGCDHTNTELVKFIDCLGLRDRVILKGPKSEMVKEYEEIGILVIPSLWGEGFPNVLGEAMLMEKVCIVSNIGDSAKILSKEDWTFEAGDKDRLKKLLKNAMSLEPNNIRLEGITNRKRIIDNYSLQAIVDAYSKFYEDF